MRWLSGSRFGREPVLQGMRVTMPFKSAKYIVVVVLTCVLLAVGQDRSAAEQASFERGRRAFIENDCYSCHGWYQVAHYRWGDLAKSAMVGADTGGDVLKPFIRHGIQCRVGLTTPMMPAYWDVPEDELSDLIDYIHFERQDRRYQELTSEGLTLGDARKGEAFFAGAGQCNRCHSASNDLAGIAKKYDFAELRRRLLRPGSDTDSMEVKGLSAHRNRLEHYRSSELRDLLAYLLRLR